MTYRCCECGGTNVQLAFWANPNLKVVEWGEPVFNMNRAPANIQSQYCLDCDKEVELTDRDVKIFNYFNSTMDADVQDVLEFAKSAAKPGRHLTYLEPNDLAGYDGLQNGVAVIWKGEEDTHINGIRDAFIDQWEADCKGEGEGCEG